jgi:hypothetical protein
VYILHLVQGQALIMKQHDAVHSGSVPFSHEGRQVAYWDWNRKLLQALYTELLPQFIMKIRDMYKVPLKLSTALL